MQIKSVLDDRYGDSWRISKHQYGDENNMIFAHFPDQREQRLMQEDMNTALSKTDLKAYWFLRISSRFFFFVNTIQTKLNVKQVYVRECTVHLSRCWFSLLI